MGSLHSCALRAPLPVPPLLFSIYLSSNFNLNPVRFGRLVLQFTLSIDASNNWMIPLKTSFLLPHSWYGVLFLSFCFSQVLGAAFGKQISNLFPELSKIISGNLCALPQLCHSWKIFVQSSSSNCLHWLLFRVTLQYLSGRDFSSFYKNKNYTKEVLWFFFFFLKRHSLCTLRRGDGEVAQIQ